MNETRTSQAAQGGSVHVRARRAKTLAVITAAVLLGAYADIGQYALGFWGTLPEAGTPWVLMAFFGGRPARRPPSAALAGAGLILVGLGTYVALMHLVYGTSLYNLTNDGRAAYWVALAILLGGVGGLFGSWTSSENERLRQCAWGFAIGVPVAEAAHVLLTSGLPSAPGLALVLLLLGAAVAALATRKVSWFGLLVSTAGWVAVGYNASLVMY